ncbi:threonine-phosphate decarboxylase CobD [Halopseudomonas sp.]|uniref:threonine-phosphate decarboxylase CobD n=1 Tax=Halopseudomonas sp. TaxID=2901191 RepID=UPI0030032474
MLEHGGRLRRAASEFGLPPEQWLDLSTGLAPYHWPVPPLPQSVWSRLPEPDDGLSDLAADFYGAALALPVAGSQAAIQALPQLRSPCRVGILEPTYAEHRHAWQRAGHQVVSLSADLPAQQLAQLDVLVVVNPNNPTGERLPAARLLQWRECLSQRGGWLVVDEAFMDATPGYSLAEHSQLPGLVVLRSVGKFFGLAGLRLGFVLGAEALLAALEEQLGPWAVSGPARAVGQAILADRRTQQLWRSRLRQDSVRLSELLTSLGLDNGGGCTLFQWRQPGALEAQLIYRGLARRGVLVRQFPELAGLRFGLPRSESDWQRLRQALYDCLKELA